MPYSYTDLINGYASAGVTRGRTVYVTSDLMRLLAYESRDRHEILGAHYKALRELLGDEGTLVVPTGSANLCNTDIPFDPESTPVHRLGVFSEYVRTLPGARRSFHPFVSYTAIGPRAEEITADCSRHAYGPESPEARMIALDSLNVSVGIEPRHSCSTVHHVEHLMAVPYRYTKEFEHPVKRDGSLVSENFYLYVWYRDCGIERSNTLWIWEKLDRTDLATKVAVGGGHVWGYSSRRFVELVTKMMVQDPYIWCIRAPERRPWRH